MGDLIYVTGDFLKGIGISNTLIIVVVMLFILIGLVYIYDQIEPYFRHGNTKDMKYGWYKVEVINENGDIKDVVTVKAFGTFNAVVKASKKVNGARFKPTKLIKE